MKRYKDAKAKKIRVTVTLDSDVAPALERWRAQRRPIPKITRSVNDLLRLGLKKYPSPTKRKTDEVKR